MSAKEKKWARDQKNALLKREIERIILKNQPVDVFKKLDQLDEEEELRYTIGAKVYYRPGLGYCVPGVIVCNERRTYHSHWDGSLDYDGFGIIPDDRVITVAFKRSEDKGDIIRKGILNGSFKVWNGDSRIVLRRFLVETDIPKSEYHDKDLEMKISTLIFKNAL